MTFAVIHTGGKQYKVSANDTLRLEKLSVEEGQIVNFDQVLLTNKDDDIDIGLPLLEGDERVIGFNRVGGAAGEAAKDQQLVGLLERTRRIEGTAQAQHPIRPLTADRLQPSNKSVGGQGHQNSPATRPCLGSRTSSHCSSPTP